MAKSTMLWCPVSSSFGLFVELPNTVEGLIHITTLPGFYHFNERDLTLRGEKSGVTFRVGQEIRIRVERADKMTGEIDFSYIPSKLDLIEKSLKHRAVKIEMGSLSPLLLRKKNESKGALERTSASILQKTRRKRVRNLFTRK